MNFDVIWIPSAEEQLTEIWLNATDRTAVTEASDRIDQLLGRDPANAGESRLDDRRVLIDLPLVVYFEVSKPDRRVRILRVVTARSVE